jgi:hypothetical protein
MNAVAGDPIPLYGRKQARKRPAVGPHLKPGFLIRIAAYDAICATLPLGSVGFENKTDEHGQRLIWLTPKNTLMFAWIERGRLSTRFTVQASRSPWWSARRAIRRRMPAH